MTDSLFRQAFFWGRKWDAPMTDDMLPMPPEIAQKMADRTECAWCQERLDLDQDDILFLPHTTAHLECHLRSALGDVQHLEQRCLCYRGRGNEILKPEDEYPTWRASAKASLQWMIDNGQGRFHA